MELIRESYVYHLWTLLLSLYDQSAAHRLLDHFYQRCSVWLNNSRILTVCCREGIVSKQWSDSLSCRWAERLINLPGWLLHQLYKAIQPLLDNSFFCRLAFQIGDETAVVQFWIIALLWIIPFKHWNNAYSLIGFVLILGTFWLRCMHNPSARLDLQSIGFYPCVLFAAVCLAVPLSSHPNLSGRFLLYHLSAALCVLVTVSAVRHTADLQRLAAGGAVCVAVSSCYGIFQRIQGVAVNRSYVDISLNAGMPGRVYSFFDNPNTFAEVLLLLLPVVIGLLLGTKHWIPRILTAAAVIVGCAAMLMTYSRASWVGLACAAAVFVFLWNPRLLPLFFFLCVLAVPFLPSTIFNRILTITNTSDTSTASRIPLMAAAIAVIRKSPITGAGLGIDAVQKFIKDFQLYKGYAPFVHAHNIFLQIWVEIGLAGVVCYVGGMLWNIKQGAYAARHNPNSPARIITCGAVAALAGSMVCGLADYLWNYPRVLCIFWFVFALAIAGVKVQRQEISSTGKSNDQ